MVSVTDNDYRYLLHHLIKEISNEFEKLKKEQYYRNANQINHFIHLFSRNMFTLCLIFQDSDSHQKIGRFDWK